MEMQLNAWNGKTYQVAEGTKVLLVNKATIAACTVLLGCSAVLGHAVPKLIGNIRNS